MSQFVLAHHKCFLLYETERETLITGRAGARERAMLRPQLFAVRCRTTSQTFRGELYIYRFDGCRCMHHNYYSHHVAVVHIPCQWKAASIDIVQLHYRKAFASRTQFSSSWHAHAVTHESFMHQQTSMPDIYAVNTQFQYSL